MSWKSKLFVISVFLSILGLFLPYPTSLVVVFVSSISIFLIMGALPFIVSTLVIGMIVLTPILARIAIGEFYSGLFFRDFGNYSENREELQQTPNIKLKISKVRSMEVDGIGLKVEIKKGATDTLLFGKMRLRSLEGYLRVHSSGSGKIVSGDLDSLEINGMGMNVSGNGEVRNLEVNGVNSSVRLSNITDLNLEVNGMNNSLDFEIHGNVQAEINGMSNDIKITFTSDSSGEAFFNVNGAGNLVRIYIQSGSKIRIKSKPTFFNDVKIIRLK